MKKLASGQSFGLRRGRLSTWVLAVLFPMTLLFGGCAGEETRVDDTDDDEETSASSTTGGGGEGGDGKGGAGGAGGAASSSSSAGGAGQGGAGQGGAGGAGTGGAGPGSTSSSSTSSSSTGTGGEGGAGGVWMPPVGTAEHPAESEQNNLKATADPVAVGTMGFTGSLYPLGDIDVYSVLVTPAGSGLRVAISDGMGGCPPGAQVFVRIFGAGGLITSEKGGCPELEPGQNPELASLPQDTYFVQVESADISELPFYIIDIEVIQPGCGDGIAQPAAGEQCDDGNTVSGDGCTDLCQIETTCGDGSAYILAGEQCDDGNTANGDGCSDVCKIEGKNYTTETEPNDAATPNPIDGFDGVVASIVPAGDQDFFTFEVTVPNSSVLIETTNGAGGCPTGFDSKIYLYNPASVEIASDDDDGTDSCSKITPGIDAGATNLPVGVYKIKVEEYQNDEVQTFYVLDVKVSPPGCGDFLLSAGEQCDDGNTTPGDGCDASCMVEYACSDSVVHPVVGEQCDDGNMASGDGCSDTCQIEGKTLLNETEPNNAAGEANSLVGFDGAVATLLPVGDQDFFSFEVAVAGSSVQISTTNGFGGCPMSFDSKVYLYNPSNAEIASDDDDGVDACSIITPTTDVGANNLPAGVYTIKVEEYNNDEAQSFYVLEVKVTPPGCGDFVVQAGEECDDGNTTPGDGCDPLCQFEMNLIAEVEPNGPLDMPNSLAGYEGAAGSIDPLGDQDVFSFEVTTPGSTAVIKVTNGVGGCPSGFDSKIYLYDINDVELANDDDDGADACSQLIPATDAALKNLAVGTYKVKVEEYSNDELQPFYVLEVKVTPPGCGDTILQMGEQCDDGDQTPGDGCDALCLAEEPWEIEPNNAMTESTTLWPTFSGWRGAISPIGDVDWYVFNYPGDPATLTLETNDVGAPATCAFDTVIHLVDEMGMEIASDDDDGVGNCSKLSPALDAPLVGLPVGTYYVWVQRYNNTLAISGYELRLTIQ
jgi:cysteine-rich repeat protein